MGNGERLPATAVANEPANNPNRALLGEMAHGANICNLARASQDSGWSSLLAARAGANRTDKLLAKARRLSAPRPISRRAVGATLRPLILRISTAPIPLGGGGGSRRVAPYAISPVRMIGIGFHMPLRISKHRPRSLCYLSAHVSFTKSLTGVWSLYRF